MKQRKGGIFTALVVLTIWVSGSLNAQSQKNKDDHHPRKHKHDKHVHVEEEPSYWEGDYATGHWGGARTWLENRGVTLEFVYTGEVMANTRGGFNTEGAVEYQGIFDATAELDVEKMGGWKGGTFFFWFENLHGRGLTDNHVGDFQTLSNMEEANFTTLYEYWYKHEFWDGRFWIKAGKQEANEDFAASDYAGEFSNSSFGFPPQIPFATFPDPGLGIASGFQINDFAYIQAGLYDGAPEGKSISGFDSMFDGEGGHIGLFEFHWTPTFGENLNGTYRFGAWYHTGDWEEIPGADSLRAPNLFEPSVYDENYGFYAIFDQRLFKENKDEDDEQGLGAFFQFGWTPEERSEVGMYIGGGLTYYGLFPSRDDDVIGVGVAHAKFSDRLKATDGLEDETAYEFFYRAQVTGFLSLQPQFQYIQNPGGVEDDAIVTGLRFEISF